MSLLKPKEKIYITGPSGYLPENVVDNEAIIKWMGVKIRPEWIEGRTGIRERRWVGADDACSDIAVKAGKDLLKNKKIDPSTIEQLILATISGDYLSPPSSPLVLPQLGIESAGVLDLGAACAGFVSGLHVGASLQQATGGNQLLISADIRSKYLNPKDFATSVLFGDAAAACLISGEAEGADFCFEGSELLADPSVADIISIQAGGSRLPFHQNDDEEKDYLKMKNGAILFMKGVDLMTRSARSILKKMDTNLDDIDWVVPHQANLHLMKAIGDKLGLAEGKMVETVQFTGNISGSSVGIALNHLKDNIGIKSGQKILLVSAGAGGSAASALLTAL